MQNFSFKLYVIRKIYYIFREHLTYNQYFKKQKKENNTFYFLSFQSTKNEIMAKSMRNVKTQMNKLKISLNSLTHVYTFRKIFQSFSFKFCIIRKISINFPQFLITVSKTFLNMFISKSNVFRNF